MHRGRRTYQRNLSALGRRRCLNTRQNKFSDTNQEKCDTASCLRSSSLPLQSHCYRERCWWVDFCPAKLFKLYAKFLGSRVAETIRLTDTPWQPVGKGYVLTLPRAGANPGVRVSAFNNNSVKSNKEHLLRPATSHTKLPQAIWLKLWEHTTRRKKP